MKTYELWHRRLNLSDDSGFTLAELLVVVLILGILTSISFGIFINQRRKAWDTAIKADLRDASSYPNNTPTMTITLAPDSMSYCLAATSRSGQNWYLGSETTLGTVAC